MTLLRVLDPHRFAVRVSTGGREVATVYARTHRVEVGLALSFDVEYGSITALEQALGAIGADLCCGMQRLARLARIEVYDVEAVVVAELDNPLVHLGVVGEEGSPEMKRISIKVYVGSLEDEPKLRELFEEARRRSPLIRTLEKAVALEIEMRVVM